MSAKHEPLVSIVTPVYNGERYLRECIESILAQSYTHWDYTIVNNCSTDRTLDISRVYAAKDPRIRIHNNTKFVEVIDNWNIAFRLISPTSKYCKPLAADDMLLPDCIANMVRLAEAHPTVAIVGSYGIYSRSELGVYCKGVEYPRSVLPGREVCRSYLLENGPAVFGAATFFLFRSNIIRERGEFYNKGNIHADSEACLQVLEHHDFGFVHQILTFMRIQQDSLASKSQELNTYLPYRFSMLKKYGPKYLSDKDFQKLIRRYRREYYRYLGWQVTKGRSRDFWHYHRTQLASLGYKLNVCRIAASTLSYILDLILNPKKTIEKITCWYSLF